MYSIQHVNLVLVTWAYAITAPQSLQVGHGCGRRLAWWRRKPEWPCTTVQTIARSICSETGATSCFTNYNWWAIIFG